MAYVPVPKDLTQVKTKLVFNLTKRQLIFFSLAAAVGVPLYFLLRKRIDSGLLQSYGDSYVTVLSGSHV